MKSTELLSKEKGFFIFACIGFLCAFLWKAEKDLAIAGNIFWTGKYILGILFFALIVGGGIGSLLCLFLYKMYEGKLAGFRDKAVNFQPKLKYELGLSKLKPRQVFTGSAVLVLLSLLPIYLAYYPGICAYDTLIQLEQILKVNYIDHHPILHTLLLKWFLDIGNALGNATIGIGIYMALQALVVACAFAYGVTALHHFKIANWVLVVVQLFFMLYPFHWYMSVTTTKDTLFTAFFLVQMVSLYGLLLEHDKCGWRNLFVGMYMLGTVGMILFRNNGKYAMLVLLGILFLAILFGKKNRKLWLRIGAISLVLFLLGNLILSGLFRATNAVQGDKREMLSMPIQQLARTMVYHGGLGMEESDDNTLTAEDKALINEFILYEKYRDYRPEISDPVKSFTNTYVVRYKAKEFISTYLSLLVRYPGDYINAVLAVNAGFLSPGDVSHATINQISGQPGLGYVQTRWVDEEMAEQGIYRNSKWVSLREGLEKWADENGYLKLPVLKYLFVPGTVLWAYLLLLGICLLKRAYNRLIPLSLVLGYFGTLILGPTVQLRYSYPLMVVLPLVWILSVKVKRNA